MAAFDPKTIAAALRVTGNNQLADELEDPMRQAPQPVPAQQQPVDQPPVQEAAPVEPPLPQQIEDKAWNPNVGRGQLQREVTQGQNRALDLTTEKGEVGAQGAAQQAELYGQLEGQRKQRNDTSVGRVDGNRAQKDALEKEMFRKLDEISEREKNPPKDVMGMVMGILGAAMTAKGNSGGAVAAQMIGQAMGSKSQQWARELESDKAAIGRMKTMFDLQNDDSNNELAQEQQISALLAGQFDAALKKVGAETESKELRANAEAARNELRSKFAQHQLAVEQKKAAASGSDALWRLSIEQLSSMMANGQLGKEGQAVLTEKIKREQGQRGGEAEIEGKLADAAKKRGEGAGNDIGANVAGGFKVANPEVWASIPPPNRASFAKGAAAVPSLISTLTELRDLVRQHGTETLPGPIKSRMQALQADALGSIKEANELGALDNGVKGLVEQQTGDVTAWNFGLGNVVENADQKLDATIQAVQRNLATRATAYGLAPGLGDPPPGASEPAASPVSPSAAPVTMYRPDGRPVPVQPQFVEQATSRGWTTSPPQQQAPQPAYVNTNAGLETGLSNQRSAR